MHITRDPLARDPLCLAGSVPPTSDGNRMPLNYSQTPITPLSSERAFQEAARKYTKTYFEQLHGDHPVDDDR